jgi:hypothetical protein
MTRAYVFNMRLRRIRRLPDSAQRTGGSYWRQNKPPPEDKWPNTYKSAAGDTWGKELDDTWNWLNSNRDLNVLPLGDPPPGRSALDKMIAKGPYFPPKTTDVDPCQATAPGEGDHHC